MSTKRVKKVVKKTRSSSKKPAKKKVTVKKRKVLKKKPLKKSLKKSVRKTKLKASGKGKQKKVKAKTKIKSTTLRAKGTKGKVAFQRKTFERKKLQGKTKTLTPTFNGQPNLPKQNLSIAELFNNLHNKMLQEQDRIHGLEPRSKGFNHSQQKKHNVQTNRLTRNLHPSRGG